MLRIKSMLFAAAGIVALLVNGCYTSFAMVQAVPEAESVYVIEEYDSNDTQTVVYYDWYDYTPIYRPVRIRTTYYLDPWLNVYFYSPHRDYIVYTDPWWGTPWGITWCEPHWNFIWYSYDPWPYRYYPVYYGSYHHGWDHPYFASWSHHGGSRGYSLTPRSFNRRESDTRASGRIPMTASNHTARRSDDTRQNGQGSAGRLGKTQTARSTRVSTASSRLPVSSSNRISRTQQTQNTRDTGANAGRVSQTAGRRQTGSMNTGAGQTRVSRANSAAGQSVSKTPVTEASSGTVKRRNTSVRNTTIQTRSGSVTGTRPKSEVSSSRARVTRVVPRSETKRQGSLSKTGRSASDAGTQPKRSSRSSRNTSGTSSVRSSGSSGRTSGSTAVRSSGSSSRSSSATRSSRSGSASSGSKSGSSRKRR